MSNNSDKSRFWGYFLSISVITFFAGIVRGCTGLLAGDNFFEGFFYEAGWVIGLIILAAFVIVIGLLFGGRSKK